jgi:hypothetical protein
MVQGGKEMVERLIQSTQNGEGLATWTLPLSG